MQISLEMAVRQRRSEREGHLSELDRESLVPLIINEKELSPLSEHGPLLARQFIVSYSDRAAKERRDRFVVFGFVHPPVNIQIPAVGLLTANSGEEDDCLVRFDLRGAKTR